MRLAAAPAAMVVVVAGLLLLLRLLLRPQSHLGQKYGNENIDCELVFFIGKFKLKSNLILCYLALMKEYGLKNIENTYLCEEETVKKSLEVSSVSLF